MIWKLEHFELIKEFNFILIKFVKVYKIFEKYFKFNNLKVVWKQF